MTGAIKEVAELLARLPGVGKRTATRLAFHLLKSNPDYVAQLGYAISTFHERVCDCSVCANISDIDPCEICADPARDNKQICVVESVPDLWAIENSGTFRGKFHVLHGLLSPLDGIGPDDLNMDKLAYRVSNEEVKEVIIAVRPSVEGEATALLLKQTLSSYPLKVTRIASGIPHGSELEYSDSRTLIRALDDRRDMS